MNLDELLPQYRARGRSVVASLQSFFVEMPRGSNFLDPGDFKAAYAVFRAETGKGRDLSPEAIRSAINRDPRVWIVLRAIAGMSPPEVASIVMEEAQQAGESISIRADEARRLDARCRAGEQPLLADPSAGTLAARADHQALEAMITYLPQVISRGPAAVAPDRVHRLDQFDKRNGRASLIAALAPDHSFYDELLYERILGRPFATHRDSVSSQVGDSLEDAVMGLLERAGVSARKTRYRERVPSFGQAPDILAPSDEEGVELVEVIIEAKLAEDDGTARDKVARVKALRANEDARAAAGEPPRQVVSVLDGRGFGVRAPDLADLLNACDGHVYAAAEISKLIAPGGPLHHLLPP